MKFESACIMTVIGPSIFRFEFIFSFVLLSCVRLQCRVGREAQYKGI